MSMTEPHDIVILGGGLAGLTLARQLVLTGGTSDILLLERARGPLPDAVKVGESMFETGSHYLADVIELRDYLDAEHVRKMGMRFFFGGGEGTPFEQRPELGLSKFPRRFQTFQMDRGPLENHLRTLVRESGVTLLEGVTVESARLREDGAPHEVDYRDDSGDLHTVTARWVVDATGRRRFLQRALGLGRPTTSGHSAVWFYSRPWVDVSSFVSRKRADWHARVPDDQRRSSTTQLCGDGYWVWLIGLPGDLMSIGIVVNEPNHPFETIATEERALLWLAEHEPELAAALAKRPPSGFRTAKDYSYGSARIFSHHRWACVGEAAAFADPLLANGVDLIGIANLITGKLIELDANDQLDAPTVDAINDFVLGFCGGVTEVLQHVYPYLGRDLIASCRMLWNSLNGWVLTGPWVFDRHLLGPAMIETATRETARISILNLRMNKLFEEWAKKSHRRGSFEFIDYFAVPLVRETRARHVERSEDLDALTAKYREDVAAMEELALAIFLLAVEDVLPEELPALREHSWLNASAVSLDSTRWKKDRLFRPRSERRADVGRPDADSAAPRDIAPTLRAFRACFPALCT